MNGTDATADTAIAPTVIHVVALDRTRTWRRTALAAVAVVTLLDALLLQRKHALFTGGFLVSQQFRTVVDAIAFLLMIALANAAIVAPIVLVALTIARRLRLRPPAAQFAAMSVGILPLAIADFIIYNVWSYLGDAFDFHVMFALTGHRISEILPVTAPLMSRPLLVAALACTVVGGVTLIVQRLGDGNNRAVALPTLSSAATSCLALLLLASATVIAVSLMSGAMAGALRWTAAGQVFSLSLDELSDVDRDGYGVLRSPRDSSAFDGAIHPYAIDVPGNGIDENGLAGDLPIGQSVYAERQPSGATWLQRPTVVLFVLESVRNDSVGAVYNGRRVTPVLDALAADGLRVESAWAHAGSTTQSRYHILAGTLVERGGNRTLLDDFKSHGYEVAYFSGQDDDFGRMGINYEPADKFYDARQDINSRYSASTSPGSLAVPLNIVEARIQQFLNGRSREKPLFLYVNFHDTHYPYNHSGLQDLLGVQPLAPSAISPGRRHELIATYLNAVANVDRAIGRVLSAVETNTSQRPAAIVVGDHGESLFEQGVLGHGFALSDAQTRVPLIVAGLPAKIMMPFGLADLRWTINDALAGGRVGQASPSARWTPSARVFQYVGPTTTPGEIGWITASGRLSYDFRSDRVSLWESSLPPRALTGSPRNSFQELVHMWERIVLARSQKHQVD